MDRRHLTIALLAVFALPGVAHAAVALPAVPLTAVPVAQLPTPEEYAERAEESENAPLFQSHEPL